MKGTRAADVTRWSRSAIMRAWRSSSMAQGPQVVVVDLIAMAVPLLDHALAVRAGGAAALGQHHRVEPQPHRPPLVGDVPLLGQEVDHVVRGRWIELRGIGAVEAADVAGILDDRALHAETDAEVGHLVLARVSDRLDLALDAAIAEASGDEHPVETGNVAGQALALEPLRVDPGEFHRG